MYCQCDIDPGSGCTILNRHRREVVDVVPDPIILLGSTNLKLVSVLTAVGFCSSTPAYDGPVHQNDVSMRPPTGNYK